MAPENTLRSEEAVVDAAVLEFSISERSSFQFMDGYQRGYEWRNLGCIYSCATHSATDGDYS